MVKRVNKLIYGNEVGTILGIRENDITKELYLEKLRKEKSRKEKVEEVYWVNTLKELLSKEFTIRSGKKVRKELKTIIDEEYTFMGCKVDRRIAGENSILLCVTFRGEIKVDEINESTLLECQHNMRVSKADKCYVAYLINDKKFLFKEVKRDEAIIARIINAEKEFFKDYLLKLSTINGGD